MGVTDLDGRSLKGKNVYIDSSRDQERLLGTTITHHNGREEATVQQRLSETVRG